MPGKSPEIRNPDYDGTDWDFRARVQEGRPRGKRGIAHEAWRGPRERGKKVAREKAENHAGVTRRMTPVGSGYAGKATITKPDGSEREIVGHFALGIATLASDGCDGTFA